MSNNIASGTSDVASQLMPFGFKITTSGSVVYTLGALGEINIMTFLGGIGFVVGLLIQGISWIYRRREHKEAMDKSKLDKEISELDKNLKMSEEKRRTEEHLFKQQLVQLKIDAHKNGMSDNFVTQKNKSKIIDVFKDSEILDINDFFDTK